MDSDNKRTQTSELPDNDFKAIIIKVLQEVRADTSEENGNKKVSTNKEKNQMEILGMNNNQNRKLTRWAHKENAPWQRGSVKLKLA